MAEDRTETIGFRMTILPDQAAEYRRRHDNLWPELRDALLTAGVLDYRIFFDPDRCSLFAVLTRRREHAMGDLPGRAVMQRWWRMMSDIMSTNDDLSPRQIELIPMFGLDDQQGLVSPKVRN